MPQRSPFRGVQWDTRGKLWRARIRKKGIFMWLGRYKTDRNAAFAYDVAAKKLNGPRAKVNFPDCIAPIDVELRVTRILASRDIF